MARDKRKNEKKKKRKRKKKKEKEKETEKKKEKFTVIKNLAKLETFSIDAALTTGSMSSERALSTGTTCCAASSNPSSLAMFSMSRRINNLIHAE